MNFVHIRQRFTPGRQHLMRDVTTTTTYDNDLTRLIQRLPMPNDLLQKLIVADWYVHANSELHHQVLMLEKQAAAFGSFRIAEH
jgi:hypothetical protein